MPKGRSQFRRSSAELCIQVFLVVVKKAEKHADDEKLRMQLFTKHKKGEEHPRDYEKLFDRDIAEASRRIDLNDKDAGAYAKRATAYLCKGEYDKAISDFSKRVDLDKKNPEAYYDRGIAHFCKGNADEFIKDLKKTLDLDPGRSDVRDMLKSFAQKKKKADEA